MKNEEANAKREQIAVSHSGTQHCIITLLWWRCGVWVGYGGIYSGNKCICFWHAANGPFVLSFMLCNMHVLLSFARLQIPILLTHNIFSKGMWQSLFVKNTVWYTCSWKSELMYMKGWCIWRVSWHIFHSLFGYSRWQRYLRIFCLKTLSSPLFWFGRIFFTLDLSRNIFNNDR